MITLAQINTLSDDAFITTFSGIYEHSTWVVRDAVRPFESVDAIKAAFSGAVWGAKRDAQLALVRAHPKLGHRAGIDPDLSMASKSEQSGPGLDSLTADEYAQFQTLNDAYAEKFGIPFVICVRAVGGVAPRDTIMQAIQTRLNSTAEAELAVALTQIDMIAAFRLEDLVRA